MGLLLANSTNSLLEIVLGGTSGPSIMYSTSGVLLNGAAVSAVVTNGTISSTSSTTTIVAGSASGPIDIQAVTIFNNSSTSMPVIVEHLDATPHTVILFSITLGIGFTLAYDESSGWKVFDASGNIQTAASGSGRFIKRTYLTSTSTVAFVAQSNTNTVFIRMVGGGAQGGGGGGTTGFDGSGGGGGAYLEWGGAVTPGASYNYNAGAGGTTGTTGANGQAGANSVFTGPTTLTAPGGGAGLVGTSAAVPVTGGAGGTIPTNGQLNAVGQPGSQSYGSTALDNGSGSGGSSPLGSGGKGQANLSATTGIAASGYGGGGGGGTTTGSATAGGAGSRRDHRRRVHVSAQGRVQSLCRAPRLVQRASV